jgi:hypothetical protein
LGRGVGGWGRELEGCRARVRSEIYTGVGDGFQRGFAGLTDLQATSSALVCYIVRFGGVSRASLFFSDNGHLEHYSAQSPPNERYALAVVRLDLAVCIVSYHQSFRAEDSQNESVTVAKRLHSLRTARSLVNE